MKILHQTHHRFQGDNLSIQVYQEGSLNHCMLMREWMKCWQLRVHNVIIIAKASNVLYMLVL